MIFLSREGRLKMKQVKRMAALALCAAMMLGSTAFAAEESGTTAAPAAQESEKAAVQENGKSGSATATAQGLEETVTVTVTMKDGVLTEVKAETDKEEVTVGRMALQVIPEDMVKKNSVKVDGVAGATSTSNAVIAAATSAYLQILGVDVNLSAWAKGNGFVKAKDFNMETGVDAVASATVSGVGGLNFGDIELSDEVKKELLLEYLQGAEGNYREMYQIATSYNNVPTIGSVEFVLDPEDMTLMGSSEANTGKLNNMLKNPNVDLYWTRQIRKGDICSETMPMLPTYFMSYGVQITGTFKPIDWKSLNEEDKAKYLAKARGYFKTMGPQYASFLEMEEDAFYGFLCNSASTYYVIEPTKYVMTSPWFLNVYDSGYARQFVSEEMTAKLAAIVAEKYPEAKSLTTMDFATRVASGLKTQQTLAFER